MAGRYGKPAARQGDIGSGHEPDYPISSAIGGSANIFINGRPAMRKGDAYIPHEGENSSAPAHERFLAEGSSSVFFNGKPAGRVGDAIDCGGTHKAFAEYCPDEALARTEE